MIGGQTEQNPVKKSRKGLWKFAFGFLCLIFFAFLVLWFMQIYDAWQGKQQVEKLEKGLENWQDEEYNKAMKDTYGGKTPQETLQFYIDAVQAGDYELASKYFIGDKQEQELESLQNSEKENIEKVIKILKTLKPSDETTMKTEIEGYDFLVTFKRYPNGIWKIIEI